MRSKLQRTLRFTLTNKERFGNKSSKKREKLNEGQKKLKLRQISKLRFGLHKNQN